MRSLIFLLSISLLFFSCQKVIDVDLNDANPVVVIEAEFNANDSTVAVKISLTSSYFNSDPTLPIGNAQVFITDEIGNVTPIPVGPDSTYSINGYVPTFGTTYTLSVIYDGVTYLAESKLNAAVPQDELLIGTFPPGPFNSDTSYIPFIRYQDPLNDVNYFEIIMRRNSKVKDQLNNINTQDDALTNGNFIERPLFSVDFDLGDTIGMELRSIDENVYNYLNQAIGLLNSEDSAAPGNPQSNWNNGALGYFSAFSSSFQSKIVE